MLSNNKTNNNKMLKDNKDNNKIFLTPKDNNKMIREIIHNKMFKETILSRMLKITFLSSPSSNRHEIIIRSLNRLTIKKLNRLSNIV